MRKTNLCIVAVTLIAVACKKQPTDFNSLNMPASEGQEINFSNPCYGNTWTGVGAFNPGGKVLHLTYNNKLYVLDYPGPLVGSETLHIYDGTSWQTMYSDIPFYTDNQHAFAFTISNKGYIGVSGGTSQFYEYDFATNTFTPKAPYPGAGKNGVATFSIGNRGYVLGGSHFENGTIYHSNETWEYNPTLNTWSQKADFAWLGMSEATGFTIGSRGYLVNGKITISGGDIYSNSLIEYNPWTDDWNSKAPFPGDPRIYTNAFVIGNYAYAGGGANYLTSSWTNYQDFYKYNPANDQWTQIADISVNGRTWFNSFSINSKGYVICDDANYSPDKLVKYTPRTCPPVYTSATSSGH